MAAGKDLHRVRGDENAAKAVETLEEMAKQFPGSGYDPLFEAAEIHRKELSDGKKAKRLYKRFLSDNPDSKKAAQARYWISQL